jgi:hypothetical protein
MDARSPRAQQRQRSRSLPTADAKARCTVRIDALLERELRLHQELHRRMLDLWARARQLGGSKRRGRRNRCNPREADHLLRFAVRVECTAFLMHGSPRQCAAWLRFERLETHTPLLDMDSLVRHRLPRITAPETEPIGRCLQQTAKCGQRPERAPKLERIGVGAKPAEKLERKRERTPTRIKRASRSDLDAGVGTARPPLRRAMHALRRVPWASEEVLSSDAIDKCLDLLAIERIDAEPQSCIEFGDCGGRFAPRGLGARSECERQRDGARTSTDLGDLAGEALERARVVVEIGRAHERGKLARIALVWRGKRHDADRLRRRQAKRAPDSTDIFDAGKLAHVVERPQVDAQRSCQSLASKARRLDGEVEQPLGASLLHGIL